MKQTRKASFVEALINVAIGFVLSIIVQVITFPWFGIHIPLAYDILITVIFTVVSIARSYFLRRLFEVLRMQGVLA